jgi:light-regulated signal transduction histidine kinase (bacteriophytochrome)
LEENSQTTFLKIVLEDNGFAFNKEDIIRLSTCINKKSAGHALNSSDLDLELIEKLVKMHQGHVEILSLGTNGKRIILTLPYREKSIVSKFSNTDLLEELQKNDNVVKMY